MGCTFCKIGKKNILGTFWTWKFEVFGSTSTIKQIIKKMLFSSNQKQDLLVTKIIPGTCCFNSERNLCAKEQ